MGDHAQDTHTGSLLEERQRGLEEGEVAAESIDDEPLDPGTIRGLQKLQRAHQCRQCPAPIDVRNQEHGSLGMVRHAHVDDVPLAQVDLRGTPGALNEQQVSVLAEPRQRFGDHGPQRLAPLEVVASRESRRGYSADNDLAAAAMLGFEENRVHVHAWGSSGGARLESLRAADFAAVRGDGGIVGHILRLEGRHAYPAPCIQPAEAGGQETLAHRRRDSLDHERGGAHSARRGKSATISRANTVARRTMRMAREMSLRSGDGWSDPST